MLFLICLRIILFRTGSQKAADR